MAAEKVLFCWSSGKDSAYALNTLLHNPAYTVVGLLTTVTREYDRVSMHGVRRVLLEKQAESIGLPLEIVYIPADGANEDYDRLLAQALGGYYDRGVRSVAFGDIFLEDVRKYREERLEPIGMKALFPNWGIDTKLLSSDIVKSGIGAIITCVDTSQLDMGFAGSVITDDFLKRLPESVDPCGERGEFHSFVFDGPMFTKAIPYCIGEKVLKDNRFYFCDLMTV